MMGHVIWSPKAAKIDQIPIYTKHDLIDTVAIID